MVKERDIRRGRQNFGICVSSLIKIEMFELNIFYYLYCAVLCISLHSCTILYEYALIYLQLVRMLSLSPVSSYAETYIVTFYSEFY